MMFFIFILTILNLFPFISTNIHVNCSRQNSHIVREIITSKILPAYSRLNTVVPEKCFMNLQNDVFNNQHKHELLMHSDNWKCQFCRKEFYSQNYLWDHMDLKHTDKLLDGQFVGCLADRCDVMRCDMVDHSRYNKPDRTNWQQKLCDEEKLAPLRALCQALIEECVPPDSETIRTFLTEEICAFLNCQKYWTDLNPTSSWLNVYFCIFVFVIGFAVYYIFLFIKLNDMETDNNQQHREDDNRFARFPNINEHEHLVRHRSAT